MVPRPDTKTLTEASAEQEGKFVLGGIYLLSASFAFGNYVYRGVKDDRHRFVPLDDQGKPDEMYEPGFGMVFAVRYVDFPVNDQNIPATRVGSAIIPPLEVPR